MIVASRIPMLTERMRTATLRAARMNGLRPMIRAPRTSGGRAEHRLIVRLEAHGYRVLRPRHHRGTDIDPFSDDAA